MKFTELKGDLITLAKAGEFDVVAHGVNCFCRQKSGLAPQMVKAFQTDNPNYYLMEEISTRGDIGKLGNIDYALHYSDKILGLGNNSEIKLMAERTSQKWQGKEVPLIVVNAYIQYEPRVNNLYPENKIPLDYNALKMCFTKMNHLFQGLHIGLPHIGCGLAGGDINKVRELIDQYFTKCNVTLVEYDG